MVSLELLLRGVKILTDTPSSGKVEDEFIYNKDNEDPDQPASDVCCCAEGPVPARTRNAGRLRVGEFRNSGKSTI